MATQDKWYRCKARVMPKRNYTVWYGVATSSAHFVGTASDIAQVFRDMTGGPVNALVIRSFLRPYLIKRIPDVRTR